MREREKQRVGWGDRRAVRVRVREKARGTKGENERMRGRDGGGQKTKGEADEGEEGRE